MTHELDHVEKLMLVSLAMDRYKGNTGWIMEGDVQAAMYAFCPDLTYSTIDDTIRTISDEFVETTLGCDDRNWYRLTDAGLKATYQLLGFAV